MKRHGLRIVTAVFSAVLALLVTPAEATRIRDLIDIKGEERNIVTGLGLVTGLNGTGDKSKNGFATLRPYAELLRNLGNPVPDLAELAKVDTVALVTVTLEVPREGAREGTQHDVRVAAINNASSLAGGELYVTYLRLPERDSADLPVLAMASGTIIMEGDNPRVGRVRDGGQMLADAITDPVVNGRMYLVMKGPWREWGIAQRVAEVINSEFETFGDQAFTSVARVLDNQTIRLQLPEPYLAQPAEFIANVLSLHMDTSLIELPAAVVVNEAEGIIAISGNVEIGPVAITHAGLTITTITPPAVPTPDDPRVDVNRWTALDTTTAASRNRTNLRELLGALEALDVPAKDQIAILYELQRTGTLFGEIRTQ